MSDDIDRLKTVLENLAQVNDTLRDHHDVMRDVVNAAQPVDITTDPDGHAALADMARDIVLARCLLEDRVYEIEELDWELTVKARTKT